MERTTEIRSLYKKKIELEKELKSLEVQIQTALGLSDGTRKPCRSTLSYEARKTLFAQMEEAHERNKA